MSKLEKLKDKAKGLEAKDPKGAIESWLEVLTVQEEEGDPNPDLAVYNRIGDLYLKVKDPGQAADYYERAVDRYAELGFHNNAIAMCNKVLRNAPARQTTYLKLAKLYASKGFLAEAKQNFVEYAERMERVGKIQHAFAVLTEVTPEPDTSLEIETTSLAGEEAAPAADGMIEGFERTVDFGEVQATAPSAPSLRHELPTGDIEHLAGLEPTMEAADVESVEVELEPLAELDLEETPPPSDRKSVV